MANSPLLVAHDWGSEQVGAGLCQIMQELSRASHNSQDAQPQRSPKPPNTAYTPTSTKAEVTLTLTPCSVTSLLHSANSLCALIPRMAPIACECQWQARLIHKFRPRASHVPYEYHVAWRHVPPLTNEPIPVIYCRQVPPNTVVKYHLRTNIFRSKGFGWASR